MTEEEKIKTEEEIKAKHEKTKKKLKAVGITLISVGVVCLITGFVNMAMSVSAGNMPTLFFLLILGFPMTGVGIMLTLMGFRRELASYTMRESTPVFNEAGKEIRPGVSAIADAVKNSDDKVCPACGALNDKDSAFCKKCGAPLSKKCPDCGAELDADAAFCDKCGKKL